MTDELLRNASRETRRLGLDRQLVVDADVHHLAVLPFLGPYADRPWRDTLEKASADRLLPSVIGDRSLAGRIRRPVFAGYGPQRVDALEGNPPEPIRHLVEALGHIGIDYAVVFPNDLLSLGSHPSTEFEAAVARAYARWITERVLPHEPRIKTLLYLPFGDPEASLALIDEFADVEGVVGFLVTSVRHARVHDNPYMRLYAALEERGLPLGFHSAGHWSEYPLRFFHTFLAAHSLSFPMYNILHLTNLVLNGIPERFPRLRLLFFEAGAAWLPMIMHRLDTGFLMRPSEAPLLRRLPSEYMRQFFYTIQPLETPDRPGQMQSIFEQIGTTQIMYASDYPHWDFDMPSSITDLGFLSEEQKRDILAGNALRAFGLDGARLDRYTPSTSQTSR